MKVAMISGPYRASTLRGVVENIRAAEREALRWWDKGYAVICPHKNTALFDGECDDCMWLEGALEFVRRSDVLVMLPRWEHSEGARAELELAEQLGKEIVYAEEQRR